MGESGCGKELIARAIHDQSSRCHRPFIAINCGAIPAELLESQLFGHKKGAFTGAIADHRGKLQEADTGTLFLDEIGDMPMSMQVKLLRVLQERNVTPIGSNQLIDIDIRIIAATHRNLEEEIAAGRFRADLFYRLNVLPLQVAPLRERRSEIAELIEHFAEDLKTVDQPITLAPGLANLLQAYDWPGNVRELSNTVHRLSVLYPGQFLEAHDVDPKMLPMGVLKGLCNSLNASERLIESPGSPIRPDVAFAPSQLDGEFESILMLARGKSLKGFLSEIEKRFITQSLKECGGNVSHCAKLLKMQRTTLIERIKKYKLRATA